jgi:hypothetical protein
MLYKDQKGRKERGSQKRRAAFQTVCQRKDGVEEIEASAD